MQNYKEFSIGNHLFSFGYNLKAFAFGIYITKDTFDIHLFPFFFGFEFNGVLIDEYFAKMVLNRMNND